MGRSSTLAAGTELARGAGPPVSRALPGACKGLQFKPSSRVALRYGCG